MGDRSRVGLIFGAAGLIFGGGLFYFFKIHQPNAEKKAAQAEIAGWEQRLGEARACLLGKEPKSGNVREALAMREMMPDAWDRTTCTKHIAQLNRGVADDTGIMPVEHAWMSVDRAAAKVATAFATHVDPFGEAPDARGKPSPLPAALEELEAAHADLRKAAGMSPPPSASLPTLAIVQPIAIKHAGADVTKVHAMARPSGGGVVVRGELASSKSVEILLVAGAEPRVAEIHPRAVRALPDLSWGVSAADQQLTIGPLDASGAFTSQVTLTTKAWPDVLALAGKPGDGVVAVHTSVEDTQELAFARATGGGAFTLDKPITGMRDVVSRIDPSGRAAIAWSTQDGAVSGAILRDGAPPKILPLGSGYMRNVCLTATHAWVGDGQQYIRFDDTAAQPHVMSGYMLMGCTATHALLGKSNGLDYAVCGESCRPAKLPLRTWLVALAGDQVIGVRARGSVVGLWREAGSPQFVGLPGELEVELVHSDGKVLDVIGNVDGKASLVRIPLAK